ncbi:MAG: metallophosphoesterase [Candidatus Hydrogenedentes bacterium]|nr:metallophosphoesterase [Candidatus Hydrogenedentota bacterium]
MKISRRRAVGLMLFAPWAAAAQDSVVAPDTRRRGNRPPGNRGPGGPQHNPDQKKASTFYTDVPAHDFDIILGRPTADAITASVLSYAEIEGFFSYGSDPSKLDQESAPQRFRAGEPVEVVLTKLRPNQAYSYCFNWRRAGATDYTADGPRRFQTQRSRGSEFTFTVQADSHLDDPQAASLYTNTLRAVQADAPDFHIDLGDTFMTDKRGQQFATAQSQYLAQRYYLGLVGHSAPVFLVLGNHDGETGSRFYGKGDSMPGWSNAMRRRYFPNPLPNGFYTGNNMPTDPLGLLQDYYSWEWGNALSVVLDPYWFTTSRSKGPAAFWERSLGETQYRWLESTLAKSNAPFRFVFIHNLVGGGDEAMRGGAEAARFFEWGGRNLDGTPEFAQHRPGWPAPIHDVLKKYGVSVVFHGHDHFFARQELDGIVYQLVPQPATPGGRNVTRMVSEYGYVSGDFLPSPGYLWVSVGNSETHVVFKNTSSEKAEQAFEYRIPSSQRNMGSAGKK